MKKLLSSFVLSMTIVLLVACSQSQPQFTPIPSNAFYSTPRPQSTSTITNTPEPTITATQTPLPTLTMLSVPVPDPLVSNPELFNSSINEFIATYRQSLSNIKMDYRSFIDKEGNQYVIGFDQESNVPLIIYDRSKESGYEWKVITLRDLGEKVEIEIGTSATSGMMNSPEYSDTARKEFSLFMPDEEFLQNPTEYGLKYGIGLNTHPEKADLMANFARENDMVLRIAHGFWRHDISEELANSSASEVENYMQKRVNRLLDYVEKGKRTEIVFVNEAFILSDQMYDTIFYRIYGRDWVKVAYLLFYKYASQRGLEVGKDVVLMYCDDALDMPKEKDSAVFNYLKSIKSEISQELGISEEEVQLDVNMQFHMHADAENYRGWDSVYTKSLDKEKIIWNIDRFSEIGSVHLGEITVSGKTDLHTKADAVGLIVEACLESIDCKSILFFTVLDLGSYSPGLFDQITYKKQEPYWTISKILFEKLLNQ